MKLVPGNVCEDEKENYVVKSCPPHSLKQGNLKDPSTHCQASRTLISISLDFETTETTRALLLQRESMPQRTQAHNFVLAPTCDILAIIHFLALCLHFYPPFPSFWSRPRILDIFTFKWILLMTEECTKTHFCWMEGGRSELLIFLNVSAYGLVSVYFIYVLWLQWKVNVNKGCYFEWWVKPYNHVRSEALTA